VDHALPAGQLMELGDPLGGDLLAEHYLHLVLPLASCRPGTSMRLRGRPDIGRKDYNRLVDALFRAAAA
jgi:hypothetical protein